MGKTNPTLPNSPLPLRAEPLDTSFSTRQVFTANMPKNKGKGGKNRRRGTKENDDQRRELTFKEDGQEYAQVVKMLGNGRLEAMCFDGSKRLANIRGKMRKKVWINQGDIILLSLRDFQNAKINETDTFNQGEDGEAYFEFGDADSDEESDDAAPGGGKKEVDIDDI